MRGSQVSVRELRVPQEQKRNLPAFAPHVEKRSGGRSNDGAMLPTRIQNDPRDGQPQLLCDQPRCRAAQMDREPSGRTLQQGAKHSLATHRIEALCPEHLFLFEEEPCGTCRHDVTAPQLELLSTTRP